MNADGTTTTMRDLNRIQVYNASYTWNQKYFDLHGFYRTGHYHWGYEGDIFGLYPKPIMVLIWTSTMDRHLSVLNSPEKRNQRAESSFRT
jgi:hypothetical protein